MATGPSESGSVADERTLHSAEHRAYRELYASSRHLIRRWRRIAGSLKDPQIADRLSDGAAETSVLLTELAPRTASYGLYGEPTAEALGARMADVRTALLDRSGDTGMVVRSAVLDMDHVTTLLRHLSALARARGDLSMAGFCEEWAIRLESNLGAVREAAVELGANPDRASAPLSDSIVDRAAHGVGWVFGAIGEGVDSLIGRRRG
jgi:hypothetical protein